MPQDAQIPFTALSALPAFPGADSYIAGERRYHPQAGFRSTRHCGPPEKSSRSTPVVIHQSRRQRPAIAINKQDSARCAIHRDAIDGRRAGGQRSESLSASGRDSTPPFLSVLFVSCSVAAAGQFVRSDGQHLAGAGDSDCGYALSA